MEYDVFVSHSAKDKTTADAVCAKLEAEGIRCWIAPRDILPGRDWGEAIVEAIEGCRVMILIFSAHANESNQIKRELERAVHKGKIIIPFRIEDVAPAKSLEYFISTSHWLDAITAPLEKHIAYLQRTISSLLNDETGAKLKEFESGMPGKKGGLKSINSGSSSFKIFMIIVILALAAFAALYYFRYPERTSDELSQQNIYVNTGETGSDPQGSNNNAPLWKEMLSEARKLRYRGKITEALAAYSRYEDQFGDIYPSTHDYITAVQAFTLQKDKTGYSGGVYIYEIMPDGIASRAGLGIGDIIVSYGGMKVESPDDLFAARAALEPGSPVRVVYLHLDSTGHFPEKEVIIENDVLAAGIMDF